MVLYEGGNSDALFSGEVQFFLDFLIVGLSPEEGLVTSPEVCSDGVCFKTRRVTISRTCRLAERVASRPPTVAAHFGGLRRNGTTASARERNDGTREGDRIRRDWLSRPPRRPAFARVRIFDTSRVAASGTHRRALSHCQIVHATNLLAGWAHAAATTSCHVCMADALKARCVLAEVRWRWTLKVL